MDTTEYGTIVEQGDSVIDVNPEHDGYTSITLITVYDNTSMTSIILGYEYF